MNSQTQRVDVLNQHPFFSERSGLAEAVAALEAKTGIRLPQRFQAALNDSFQIGQGRAELGRVHRYYIFGLHQEKGSMYRAFENKNMLKVFFTQLNGQAGIEPEDVAFWTREVNNMPDWKSQ